MSPVADITTDEALAVAVAIKQTRMASMNPLEQRRVERIEASKPGRRRWAEQITQTVQDEADDLVARHSRQILADAEALLRQADPVALSNQPLHLIDFDTIGTRSTTVGGFTMAAGVFDVLRPILPADAEPGPVITVNVRAEFHDATANLPAATSESDIVGNAAWYVGGTVLHEYAHIVTEAAAGRRIESPIALYHPDRVRALAAVLEATQSEAQQAPHHPVEWVRAFCYLAHRAGAVERFVEDVGLYYRDAEAIATALRLEALMADHREPIIDILRRSPPAKFLAAANPLTFQEDSPCR